MDDKFGLYDEVVRDTIAYFYAASKNSDYISLYNFNPKDKDHLYLYSVARIVKNLFGKKKIKINLSLFKYLSFLFKHRKDGIARGKKEGVNCSNLIFEYNKMKTKKEKVKLSDIYEHYYEVKK